VVSFELCSCIFVCCLKKACRFVLFPVRKTGVFFFFFSARLAQIAKNAKNALLNSDTWREVAKCQGIRCLLPYQVNSDSSL
jgi:hypothetical protein